MPCRCSAISQIKQELSDLNQTKQYICNAINYSDYVTPSEKEGGNSFKAGFSLMNKQIDIASGIENNFYGVKKVIEQTSGEVDDMINQLNSTLSQYYSQDHNHHKQEQLNAMNLNNKK